MSTVEKQMDSMNNLEEGSAIVEDESEQKSIAGLNELLEQELKEEDSVDRYIPLHCFMDEDVRRYTRLNHEDEASVVPDTTLFSSKEGASTDNTSSTLEAELEIPDDREKEVPFKIVNEAEDLQSCEEGNESGTVLESTEQEIIDQDTGETEETGEDDMVDENGMETVETEEESSQVSEEVGSDLKDQATDEHNVEQNTKGSSEEETDKEGQTDETHESEEVESPSEMQNSIPEESEEAANCQSAQDENATEVSEGISTDKLLPQDEETDCKENTTSITDTVDASSNPISDSPALSPVFRISSNSEAKNVQETTSNPTPDKPALSPVFKISSSSEGKNVEETTSSPAPDTPALSPVFKISSSSEGKTVKETTNSPIADTPALSPVFKISRSNEAKNVKEIHTPIIIRTARLVKNDSEVLTKTADDCQVSDDKAKEHIITSLKSYRIVKVSASTTRITDKSGVGDLTRKEDIDESAKSAEPEEKKPNSSDETKEEETPKEVQNDDAVNSNVSTPKVILTKKVYTNTKKSPMSKQEKKVPSTEASTTDTQNHNKDEVKDVNMDNGVQVSGKTKVLPEKRGRPSPTKSVSEKEVGSSCIEKGETNFATVKRKFEEVNRISRQEEEAAIKEIKKMKKETLDVLKKINGEMKKLKLIFLAGN